MVTCAFCGKSITVLGTLDAGGELRVDTKYWREDNPRIYFCDGYCATGLHEQELNEQRTKQQD